MADEKRYWPWWWQIQSAVGLIVGVGLVSLEAYRGTYDPTAMGFALAAFGITGVTELAKAVLRRTDGDEK